MVSTWLGLPEEFFAFALAVRLSALLIIVYHCITLIPEQMVYLHSRSHGLDLVLPEMRSLVVAYESCLDVFDLCHEIAIIYGY